MPPTWSAAPEAGSTPDQLINAVLELILEDGADAVTVGEVARRADVALRTVYNHFPSRAGLLEAALDRIITEIESALAAAGADEGDPTDRIHNFINAAFQEFDRLGILLTRILSIRGVPELERRLAELNRARLARITAIVEDIDAAGTGRLPAEHATALAGALMGHGSWETLVQTGGLSSRRAGDLLGQALVTGLVRSPADGTRRAGGRS